jgi:hypothetical protein
MILQSQNHETAEWASLETCTRYSFIESSDKEQGAERSPGQWRAMEVPSIHANVFKRMPPLTAALIVNGESKIVRISPLQTRTDDFPPLYYQATYCAPLVPGPIEASLI